KKHAIFREWPRDPNGKNLAAGSKFRGKETPNGLLSWGATLYDFYCIRPILQEDCLIAIMSGSHIAATVRAAGETELAANQLAWADREADPCEVPVVDPGRLIEPLSSPFHPSHYPEPWPFFPFSNPKLSTLLQKRIPPHVLPETLYVHDPYDLLSV
ncbi:hypothetical protein J3A83DRAFT_4066727, partial [Scleroderma citrinum]